eukprot:c24477_g1_i1 orf=487-1197(-)
MSGSRNCADSSILMRAQQCNDGEEDEACCGDGELAEMGCGIPGEAYQVLHKLAGKWTDILDARDLILRPLKGALTNHVYECHWPRQSGKDPRKVLLRVYGEGCDLFFKRKDEILAFQRMSEKGQGPQLLGRFRNGRVEEFLNARTLTALDLRNPEISACIATKLREFHQLDMPGSLQPQLWERLRTMNMLVSILWLLILPITSVKCLQITIQKLPTWLISQSIQTSRSAVISLSHI